MALIYMHYNIISDKAYIGLTTKTMSARFASHLKCADRQPIYHFHKALSKYPRNSWISVILEDNINCKIELYKKEQQWIKYYNTYKEGYNMTKGGEGTLGMATYFDSENKETIFAEIGTVKYNHIHKNKATVRDNHGNIFHVDVNDPRYINGELIHVTKGKSVGIDKQGNISQVSKTDPRWLSGDLKGVTSGTIQVRDHNNKKFFVDVNDSRYLNGDLVPICSKQINTPYGIFNSISTFTSWYKENHNIIIAIPTLRAFINNNKCFSRQTHTLSKLNYNIKNVVNLTSKELGWYYI